MTAKRLSFRQSVCASVVQSGAPALPSWRRAILLAPCSVNQMLPSSPLVIAHGADDEDGTGIHVMAPSGVIRPMWSERSVNQRFPSGPAEIECVLELRGNVRTSPVVVIRPIPPSFILALWPAVCGRPKMPGYFGNVSPMGF